MRRALLLLLFVRLVAADALDVSKLDAIVEKARKDWQAPGIAVAIVRDDQVLVAKGYGVRELGKPDAVTPRTVFAIGSCTKAFTTASMAMLIDEGKMNWDDPVRKYVEFFRLADPLATEMVTLRDLVCHRTGLSRHDVLWGGTPLGREEIIRRVAYIPLTRPFRSTWQYQNIMFSTAGVAVGRASGGTWEQFVERRIFGPLGMTGASVSTGPAERAADHATPHRRTPERIAPIAWRNLDNIGPAGSINASVEDLTRWVRMQLAGGTFEGRRLISERNVAEMHTPQMVMRPEDAGRNVNPDVAMRAYGLGWFLLDYRGIHMVLHGGAIDGFRADVALVPAQKLGIVVLSNLEQDNVPEAVRWAILDWIENFPSRDWNALLIGERDKGAGAAQAATRQRAAARRPDTKPSRELAAYPGVYRDPGYGDVSISLDGAALRLDWLNHQGALEHYHFDTFSLQSPRMRGTPVAFRLRADGEVDSLSMLDVEFRRVRAK